MAITSQARPAGAIGDVNVKDWNAAGLLKASVVKPVLTTIEAALVIRTLGELTADDQHALRQALATILG